METTIRVAQTHTLKTPLMALGVFGAKDKNPVFEALDKTMGGVLKKLAKEESFKGKPGQLLSVTGVDTVKATRIVIAGVGNAGKFPSSQVRSFAHRIGRMVRDKGLTSFTIIAPELEGVDQTDVVKWLDEGAGSGVYRFEEFLTGDRKPKKTPSRCTIVIAKESRSKIRRVSKAHKESIALGDAAVQGLELVRDLVNTPANQLSPQMLAKRADSMAGQVGLDIEIWGHKKIKSKGMNLLTAVGQGSSNPPRFVHLKYRPSKPLGTVALVGKGVVFDSGGLSLKGPKSQMDMKSDMGGAALVLGAMKAAALADLPYHIHGLIPIAENMPGGNAIRPGDIFTALNGKTVEVLNTDAEGRLILADALSYATKLKPDAIIDFATLTGACLVALGPYRAGMFATDESWAKRYQAAAKNAGEPLWRLPLASELKEGLKSRVADSRNIGGPYGGTITAALFLREFVGKTPWLHLDIAGPAYLDKARSFYPKGGTGYGVLTLMELLSAQSSSLVV